MVPDSVAAGSVGEAEELRIRLLGTFRVVVGSRVVEEAAWRLRKAKSLVKLLALAPDYRLHREQLLEHLWPELDPEAAANNLKQALHFSRRALEPALLSGTAPSYLQVQDGMITLVPRAGLWIDVEAFAAAAAVARQAQDPEAYHAALALYAGELLPEDLYEDWACGRREALRGLFVALLLELSALHDARSKHTQAIEALQRALAHDPAHEQTHAGLMRLYAQTGQRQQALRQYRQLQEALRRELEVEPALASLRLYEEILAGRYPGGIDLIPRPPSPQGKGEQVLPSPRRGGGMGREVGPPHNLPIHLTSFIGREREIVEVKHLLSGARPLTLTGVGGCGKTRLALQVAGDVRQTYPDGVWLMEMAPLADPALVTQAVAAALGVRQTPGCPLTQTLADALHSRRLLLVLDNCEHLLEACAALADALLRACPSLQILATSRQALGIAGETVWRVPALGLPGRDRLLPKGAELVSTFTQYDAIRLFLERARLSHPGFALTNGNAATVAQVCHRLDGIPLAIELAAARLSVLAVEQIAARLDDRLRLLTRGSRTAPPRQQTLRATMDWSYNLLSARERLLFHRLAVFAGSWTLAAAEAVAPVPGSEFQVPSPAAANQELGTKNPELQVEDVLDLLSQLVEKSLIMVEEQRGGGVRYRLLESVREYADEKLRALGEETAVCRRHRDWCLTLAEQSAPERQALYNRLETEHDNLRAALRWSIASGEAEPAWRLARELSRLWSLRGFVAEGRGWLAALLALPGMRASDVARAGALTRAGWLAHLDGDPAAARALYEESLAIFRQLGDRQGSVHALHGLSDVALAAGDYATARTHLEAWLEIARQLGNRRAAAAALQHLGSVAHEQCEYAAARALYEESLAIQRELSDTGQMIYTLINLGILALDSGDYPAARRLLVEGVALPREWGYKWPVAVVLGGFACMAAAEAHPVRSLRLAGAAAALSEAAHVSIRSIFPGMPARLQRWLEVARQALGEEAWAAAWAEGHAMNLEQAVAYALAEEGRASPD